MTTDINKIETKKDVRNQIFCHNLKKYKELSEEKIKLEKIRAEFNDGIRMMKAIKKYKTDEFGDCSVDDYISNLEATWESQQGSNDSNAKETSKNGSETDADAAAWVVDVGYCLYRLGHCNIFEI